MVEWWIEHTGRWAKVGLATNQQDGKAQQLHQQECKVVHQLSLNYLLRLVALCLVFSFNVMAELSQIWASVLLLTKTQDGAECVEEGDDVEEDEGGEDGRAETDFVLIAKRLHLKSSKC